MPYQYEYGNEGPANAKHYWSGPPDGSQIYAHTRAAQMRNIYGTDNPDEIKARLAEEAMQAQAVEADRSYAYRQQIEQNMAPEKNAQALDLYRGKQEIDAQYREPSLESFLFGGIKPFERVPATPLAPNEDGTMPERMQPTEEGLSALSFFRDAKRSGTAMPLSEFEQREQIKTDYAKDRTTHSTDEGTRGYKEKYEDSNEFQRAKALYAAEMQHLENTPMKPTERKIAADKAFTKFQGAISGGGAPAPSPGGSAAPQAGADGKVNVKINGQIVRMTPEELAAERAKRKAAAGGI
jgi:hypothetical protein